MRTSATLKVYFHDLEQPDLMITWGGHKRRKRLRPESLLVEWDQLSGSSTWHVAHVYLMGAYVHANSHCSISTTLYEHDGPRWKDSGGTWSDITPEWVKELVDACMPTHVPVARV